MNQSIPPGYVKASETIDALRIFKTLNDLWDEANAVDTVIGRPDVLLKKIDKLRSEVGSAVNCYIPKFAAGATPAPCVVLTPEERTAFERFYETWEDSEGYDLPKKMMQRLAKVGVIHHITAGRYDITEFGHSVLAAATRPGFDLITHLHRQIAFSPGERTAGVLDHIRKELIEIEAAPTDLTEWVDLLLLALDGAWRAGHTAEAICQGIDAKQTKNEARTWPDWRTVAPGKAIEHVRSGEPSATLVPDMFWNNDDAEKQYGSIDEFLNDEICNGSLEVGDVRTVQRGVRLPNIDIKVTAIDDEKCEAEWEVVSAPATQQDQTP